MLRWLFFLELCVLGASRARRSRPQSQGRGAAQLFREIGKGQLRITAEERPNILLISTDQQRRQTLGCYDEWAREGLLSPAADRLARSGVRFTEAYAAAPSCTPSRTSILLGVHVPVHTVVENGLNRWSPLLTPFTDVLAREGNYATALFGKSGFMPIPDSLARDEVSREGDDMSSWVFEMRRAARDERRTEGTSQWEYLETFLANKTMSWIARQYSQGRRNRPWFAWLSMLSPHGPNVVPNDYQFPYALSDLRPLPSLDRQPNDIDSLSEQTKRLLDLSNSARTPSRDTIDAHRRRYYRQAAYVDTQVGRILRFLEEELPSGASDNTLIIYTSDHGSMLHDHGLTDKHTLHTESLAVPLIIRWPRLIRKDSIASFASLLDLAPSMLVAAGVRIPASYQGFDLISPLTVAPEMQSRLEKRRVIVATDVFGYALVTPSYKLLLYPNERLSYPLSATPTLVSGRLYDRRNDPGEHQDLWGEANDAEAHALAGEPVEEKDGRSAERRLKLARTRRRLEAALLRWSARQWNLAQMWSQIHRGPKYVGKFTSLLFDLIENTTGYDSERDLQLDAFGIAAGDRISGH